MEVDQTSVADSGRYLRQTLLVYYLVSVFFQLSTPMACELTALEIFLQE